MLLLEGGGALALSAEPYTTQLLSSEDRAWDYVRREAKKLRSLCTYYARVIREDPEDLFGDVCLVRAVDVARTWREPIGVPFDAHMYIGLRWYLFKYTARVRKRMIMTQGFVGDEASRVSTDHSSSFEVIQILDRLAPDEAEFLMLHHLEGRTITDIAETFGCTRWFVRKTLARALRKARELA